MGLDVTLYFPVDVGKDDPEEHIVYTANITHNLGEMAAAAELYHALWRPGEVGCERAEDIAPRIERGLRRLRGDPNVYRALNPENGWGNYEALVSFAEEYLAACEAYPRAHIHVCR
jgi:hypothetical protein